MKLKKVDKAGLEKAVKGKPEKGEEKRKTRSVGEVRQALYGKE